MVKLAVSIPGGDIVKELDVVAIVPRLSVTFRVMVKVPEFVYVWLGDRLVLVAPSPRLQLKPYGEAPPVPVPVKLTSWPDKG
jgi:hypothetical protein